MTGSSCTNNRRLATYRTDGTTVSPSTMSGTQIGKLCVSIATHNHIYLRSEELNDLLNATGWIQTHPIAFKYTLIF